MHNFSMYFINGQAHCILSMPSYRFSLSMYIYRDTLIIYILVYFKCNKCSLNVIIVFFIKVRVSFNVNFYNAER